MMRQKLLMWIHQQQIIFVPYESDVLIPYQPVNLEFAEIHSEENTLENNFLQNVNPVSRSHSLGMNTMIKWKIKSLSSSPQRHCRFLGDLN